MYNNRAPLPLPQVKQLMPHTYCQGFILSYRRGWARLLQSILAGWHPAQVAVCARLLALRC